MNNCLWIGIGAVIDKNSNLYMDLMKINDFLTKEMSGGLGYSNALKPHLNFYDLSVPPDNIRDIDSSLNEVLKNQKPIDSHISGIKFFKFGIIYAEIEVNEQLVELHQKILEAINPYKGDCIDPDYQKIIPKLSEDQKKSLYNFGNPYMTDFKPHITLGYLPNKIDTLGEIVSKIEPMLGVRDFTLNMFDLVKGKDSKEIEIVREYKFT